MIPITSENTLPAQPTLGHALDRWFALVRGSLDPSVEQLYRRAVDFLGSGIRGRSISVDLPTAQGRSWPVLSRVPSPLNGYEASRTAAASSTCRGMPIRS
jgi:hypothetical protein